jgi:hypothetical protein
VAVLITSCQVSTLRKMTIVGSQSTTSAAEIAKKVAPLTMSEAPSANRSKRVRLGREREPSRPPA